jgi:hypothetical protein
MSVSAFDLVFLGTIYAFMPVLLETDATRCVTVFQGSSR